MTFYFTEVCATNLPSKLIPANLLLEILSRLPCTMMCYASVVSFYGEQVVGIFEKRTELSKIWMEFRMD